MAVTGVTWVPWDRSLRGQKLERVRTVAVDEADREEEGQDVEEDPEGHLDKPPPVLQVLVALVALVLDAHHRQRHQPKEKLHRALAVKRCLQAAIAHWGT